MKLTDLTIKQLSRGLREKEFSTVEVAGEYLKEIEKKDRELEAYLSTDKEGALSTARRVDEMLAGGGAVSYLAGIPLAIKDIILIEG